MTARSNNGMHPTRDTHHFMFFCGAGGRVMPGVRLLRVGMADLLMLRISGLVELLLGIVLMLGNRPIGSAIRRAQNSLWGLGPEYDAHTPNRVACVIVGAFFIGVGLLSLTGLTHPR